MGGKQLGHRFAEGFAYGDYEQTTAKKRTKREMFLAEMEKVVPWQAPIDLIEPHYPKTGSKGGRPSLPTDHHAADPPVETVVFAIDPGM